MKVWTKVLLIFAIALPLVLGISLMAHAKILNTSASAANPNNDEVNEQYSEDNTCENHWWNWGNICENRWED